MNKLIASVGVIALSSSVLHALETGALNAQQSKKAWSVSASLRGFYDDNFNSQPSASKQSSTGFDVAPSVNFGVAGEQSSLNVGYDLTARYYEKAVSGRTDHTDFTHNFNVTATHAFDERFRVNGRESFVVGQEPDFLSGGQNVVNPQRVSGDNLRNYASAGASFQATSLLGFSVSYNNTIVDYDDDFNNPATQVFSSSGRLDRMEHGVNLGASWVISPQTTGKVGVQLGKTGYTRDEIIARTPYSVTIGTNVFVGNVDTRSADRDSRSQVFNVGLEHEFDSNLSVSGAVGAQRTEFPNDRNRKSAWTPWLEASFEYKLQSQTTLSGGLSYRRETSDLVAARAINSTNSVDFTSDTKTAAIYASLKHEIAQNLQGFATARYQSAKYNGGIVDGQKENFLLLGLSLAYQFNPNFEGNIGYNFDQLTTDTPGRKYDRNKFYVGVTAKY